MSEELRITLSTLLNLDRDFSTGRRAQPYPLFLSSAAAQRSWMLSPFPHQPAAAAQAPAALAIVECVKPADFEQLHEVAAAEIQRRQVVLGLGTGQMRGSFGAVIRSPNESPKPLEIRIDGVSIPANSGNAPIPKHFRLWAPTRHAMGDAAWRKLCSLHITIIGAGRSGSLIAEALHRTGAQITLVDMDKLETHNVGESALVNIDDVGLPKPQAIANRLNESSPGSSPVECVTTELDSLHTLATIRSSSLLITTVDNPECRLLAAILAQFYLIPMLDLGTGIQHHFGDAGHPRDRTMGADMRLCLPDRCLLCSGGLPNTAATAASLLDSYQTDQTGTQRPWFRQRSGSLRSLNGTAVHLALRMLEDWLDNRLPPERNRLLQLRFTSDGTPQLTTTDFPHTASTTCPVCLSAGHGDSELPRLREILRTLL